MMDVVAVVEELTDVDDDDVPDADRLDEMDPVADAVGVDVAVTVAVTVPLSEMVALDDAVGVLERELVNDSVAVAESEPVGVEVFEGVMVRVRDFVSEPVPVMDLDCVHDLLVDFVDVGVMVTLRVSEIVSDMDDVSEIVGEMVGVMDFDGVMEGVTDGDVHASTTPIGTMESVVPPYPRLPFVPLPQHCTSRPPDNSAQEQE